MKLTRYLSAALALVLALSLTATYDGNAPVYCMQVCMQEGDYVCVVTFTSYIEDTTADMMGYFSLLSTETK